MKVDIIGKEFSELFDDHLSHLNKNIGTNNKMKQKYKHLKWN